MGRWKLNPYKLIRKRLRLTQDKIPGLSKVTVYRIETGQYEQLSDNMVNGLVTAVEERDIDFAEIANDLNDRYGTPYLTQAYEKWREIQRRSFGDSVTWPDLKKLRTDVSPMEAFVEEVSGTLHTFCTSLCLQGPTVVRYMSGAYQYFDPPEALEKALEQAGYAERNKLFTLQRRWIDSGS